MSEIIQLVCASSRYGCLTVQREGEVGEIFFAAGAVVHAALDEAVGTEAFRNIAMWPDGEFILEYGPLTENRTIDAPVWTLFSDTYFEDFPAII